MNMAKRISSSLSLLAAVIIAGVPFQGASATAPTLSQQNLTAKPRPNKTFLQRVAQKTAPAQATLTLADLPPGFRPLPPEVAARLFSRLEVFQQQMGQGALKPENVFAFVNPQNFQIVLGFTGQLPSQAQQASFDAGLEKIEHPEAQKRALSLLQASLQTFGEVKVTEYRTISDLSNLANASTGMALGVEMQGQPLRVDIAAFRRNKMGAFTGVVYAKGDKPLLPIREVAQKLDRRIEQSSAQ